MDEDSTRFQMLAQMEEQTRLMARQADAAELANRIALLAIITEQDHSSYYAGKLTERFKQEAGL